MTEQNTNSVLPDDAPTTAPSVPGQETSSAPVSVQEPSGTPVSVQEASDEVPAEIAELPEDSDALMALTLRELPS